MRRALLFLLALAPSLVRAETAVHPLLDLETGAVWVSRADVQVPGSTGTRFSMGSGGDFQLATSPFVRVGVGATMGRHSLLATFAPLRLRGDGSSSASIFFRNLQFTAGGSAQAVYRLDSYRLTYRYALVASPSLDLALGASAQLRDAEIRLSQPGQSASERDTGFMPLVSFRLAWKLAGGPFALSVDGDALAVGQRRTEDVAVALEFATGDLTFRGGYRLVEGGTDSGTIHDIAWLNHAVAGVSYRF